MAEREYTKRFTTANPPCGRLRYFCQPTAGRWCYLSGSKTATGYVRLIFSSSAVSATRLTHKSASRAPPASHCLSTAFPSRQCNNIIAKPAITGYTYQPRFTSLRDCDALISRLCERIEDLARVALDATVLDCGASSLPTSAVLIPYTVAAKYNSS